MPLPITLSFKHIGSTAPSGSGYTKIYSTAYAFAAIKADGSISVSMTAKAYAFE
jgi:hypothetical protein